MQEQLKVVKTLVIDILHIQTMCSYLDTPNLPNILLSEKVVKTLAIDILHIAIDILHIRIMCSYLVTGKI